MCWRKRGWYDRALAGASATEEEWPETVGGRASSAYLPFTGSVAVNPSARFTNASTARCVEHPAGNTNTKPLSGLPVKSIGTTCFSASALAEILALAAKAGARNVRVFGSAARGDDREESDLDLLVDWTPQTSLFDIGGLITDLQELLGKRVNVISPEQLHARPV